MFCLERPFSDIDKRDKIDTLLTVKIPEYSFKEKDKRGWCLSHYVACYGTLKILKEAPFYIACANSFNKGIVSYLLRFNNEEDKIKYQFNLSSSIIVSLPIVKRDVKPPQKILDVSTELSDGGVIPLHAAMTKVSSAVVGELLSELECEAEENDRFNFFAKCKNGSNLLHYLAGSKQRLNEISVLKRILSISIAKTWGKIKKDPLDEGKRKAKEELNNFLNEKNNINRIIEGIASDIRKIDFKDCIHNFKNEIKDKQIEDIANIENRECGRSRYSEVSSEQ